jgi:hypothetical protein
MVLLGHSPHLQNKKYFMVTEDAFGVYIPVAYKSGKKDFLAKLLLLLILW